MFEVSLTTKEGKSFIGYKHCYDKDVVPGCSECKRRDGAGLEELPICMKCKTGFYRVQNQEDGEKWDCKACSKWGVACTTCDHENGCL